MVKDPLVSIVTTVYNRARYIGAMIESVLAQDFADFEYIVLDDCSTDDSLAIARSYEGDRRLRVIANPKNLGDFGNRNKGVNLARGKYVKFADSDDLLYPHCVGAMLAVAEVHPEAGVVFSTRERPPWRYPIQLSPEEVYRLHFTVGAVLHQGPLSALLRRESVLAVGGFPDGFMGDVGGWLRLARRFPVVLMAEGLFLWREHSGQASETFRSASVTWAGHQVDGARLQWEALRHPECPLPANEREIYMRRIEQDYLRLMAHNALCGRLRVVNVLWRGCPFRIISAMTRVKSSSAHKTDNMSLLVESRPRQAHHIPVCKMRIRSGWIPRISVLLPVAGDLATIRETIESILCQDDEDWELIIVDDASVDGTSNVIRPYADGQRVKLVRNAARVGKWSSHNQCVGLARARYLKFIHAGDMLERGALRVFNWYVAKYPQAGLFVSGADERILMPQELVPEAVYQAEAMGVLSVMESPSGVLYPREALARAGGFDEYCPESAGKLHLAIARTAEVVFIPGGIVSYGNGSAALRISRTRGAGRTAAELEVLQAALSDDACPLSEGDRQVIIAGLERGARRAQWERRLGRSAIVRRLGRMIFREMPQLAVSSKLSSDSAIFDRTLYPGAGGVGS